MTRGRKEVKSKAETRNVTATSYEVLLLEFVLVLLRVT